MSTLADLASESFCYLTTTGRVSKNQHTIEIWFALRDRTVYMLAGGRERAHWVQNIVAEPRVDLRIKDLESEGRGRIVEDPDEEAWAREALVEKYQPTYSGDLTNWGRESLPIAIDLDAA